MEKKGIISFLYLDDILILAKNPPKLIQDRHFVLTTLQQAGLVVNQKKSILEPTQQVQHLGFLLDLQKGLLQVPEDKLKKTS